MRYIYCKRDSCIQQPVWIAGWLAGWLVGRRGKSLADGNNRLGRRYKNNNNTDDDDDDGGDCSRLAAAEQRAQCTKGGK